MRFRDSPLPEILIKVTALLSACGGPLVIYGFLKPRLGVPVAFGICFLPIALMIFGTLFMDIDGIGAFQARFVRLGLAGALLALNMHLYGVYVLATAAARGPDDGLTIVGIIVGIPTSAVYIYLTRRWLSRCGEGD